MSTGEFGQKGHAIFFSFFPTGPSDDYDSAPSRKYTGQFVPFSPVSVKALIRVIISEFYMAWRKITLKYLPIGPDWLNRLNLNFTLYW